MSSAPIYISPTGREVTEFSHSQHSEYTFCGKKYELKRIKGYFEKPGAARQFGLDLQDAIRPFYSHRSDPVELFEAAWTPRKQDEKLTYNEKESWESLYAAGRG